MGPAPSPSHLLGRRTQSVSSAWTWLGPSSGVGCSSSSKGSSRSRRGLRRGTSSGNGSMAQPDPTQADPPAFPPAARAGPLPRAASGTAHVPRRNPGNSEPPALSFLRRPGPAPRAHGGPRTAQPIGVRLLENGRTTFFQPQHMRERMVASVTNGNIFSHPLKEDQDHESGTALGLSGSGLAR